MTVFPGERKSNLHGPWFRNSRTGQYSLEFTCLKNQSSQRPELGEGKGGHKII